MPPRKSLKTKIGVIGTINRDSIHRADGRVIRSWGGILYNIKFLCEDLQVTVIPSVNVGQDCLRPVNQLFDKFKNLDRSLIHPVDEPNNHCVLYYRDQSEKREILKGGVPPLNYSLVKRLLNCDVVLVNFISGRDIKLSALERLRREFGGLIYMDIHSLTLGRVKTRGGYRRFLRKPRYWKRYAACADILQVNLIEFELMAGCGFGREAACDFLERELPRARGLIITLGAEGCLVVYRRGRIISRRIPAPTIKMVYDTTGCGDIFAAGFLTKYLRTKSFIKGAANGNRLASARCEMMGKIF